ncbi:hypothetical protein [Arenibacterium sp. LLYu02]|uniref:hypothetical protein n=1 Tax=Arenibacterium sp. LLYu02 TaxID=3404132 RepID=UPI003B21EE16
MDFGVNVAALSGTAQGLSQSVTLGMIFLLVGGVGRMIFVAFGDRMVRFNPFRNMSGQMMLLVGGAIVLSPLFFETQVNHVWTKAKSLTVEPFLTEVLGRDSCVIDETSYCVVIFEGEAELVVNWYHRGVYMWALLNPETSAVWDAPRPPRRPAAMG